MIEQDLIRNQQFAVIGRNRSTKKAAADRRLLDLTAPGVHIHTSPPWSLRMSAVLRSHRCASPNIGRSRSTF
jgi:hypothetical protein